MKKTMERVNAILFGNFSVIAGSASLKKLIAFDAETELDLTMLPDQYDLARKMRPSFIAQDGSLQISYFESRIDISADLSRISMESFLNLAVRISQFVQSEFNVKFQRLALNGSILYENLEPQEFKNCFHNYFISRIYKDDSKEWIFRLVKEEEMKSLQEKVNLIYSLSKSPLINEPTPSGMQQREIKNGVIFQFDINTLFENKEARFGDEKCAAFFEQAKIFLAELEGDFAMSLKGQEEILQ